MNDKEIAIHNETVPFKLVMEMLNQIERVTFKTEAGQRLHEDLKACISEVIRPIVKERAHEYIAEINNKNS